MAVPVVLVTAGARPVTAVESGGFPMTPVDTLGEPVTLVDAGGEPITLINEDGSPAFLAYSAKEYLNGIAPYHWFDFINDRALYASNDVGGVSGATGYSFSRASQGYYTNSDGTLTLFGCNLLLRSQEFDNASWTKTRATATADAVAAPDGTLTAEAFIEDTTAASSHEVSQSVAKAASAIAYTASVYVRPAGRDWLCFTLFDNSATGIRAWFNVTTGALGTTAAIGAGFTSVSHSIEALAGGWYRCILTATSSTVAAIRPIFYTSTADGSFSHTGDGASGLYLWGAQLEAGSQATTYIPTTSAAAGALRRGDRGVLIEGARTNTLTYSQQFNNVAWTKTASSISADAAVAPDGTTTADLLTNNGTNASHYVTHTVTIPSGTQTVLSVYVKAGTATHVHLLATVVNAWAQFNLSTGDVVFSSVGTATSLGTNAESLANGWWRFSIIVLQTGSAPLIRIYPLSASQNAAGPSEISAATMYIWQADLQAGAFPSSPIPTTTTSATRAADVLTCTLNSTAELAAAAAASPELVTNGGFDSDTAWTKGTGWTISGGKAVATAISSSVLGQAFTPTTGTAFLVTYTVTDYTSGSVRPIFSGGVNVLGTARSAVGTYTDVMVANATTLFRMGDFGAGFTGSIDNVSVKEIPAEQTALYPISLWAEFERAVDTGGIEIPLQIDSGSNADSVSMFVNASDLAACNIVSTAGGGTQATMTVAGAVAALTPLKSAARVATNDAKMARDGTLSAADTSVTLPSSPTLIRFGRSDFPPFGYIRRAAVIPSALSDANLQNVTGS